MQQYNLAPTPQTIQKRFNKLSGQSVSSPRHFDSNVPVTPVLDVNRKLRESIALVGDSGVAVPFWVHTWSYVDNQELWQRFREASYLEVTQGTIWYGAPQTPGDWNFYFTAEYLREDVPEIRKMAIGGNDFNMQDIWPEQHGIEETRPIKLPVRFEAYEDGGTLETYNLSLIELDVKRVSGGGTGFFRTTLNIDLVF